jgi:hypothetical protein
MVLPGPEFVRAIGPARNAARLGGWTWILTTGGQEVRPGRLAVRGGTIGPNRALPMRFAASSARGDETWV